MATTAQRAVTVLMLVVAAVHLLPVAGVAGIDRLQAIYGVDITDRNLEILMRHRAVLFGILCAFIGYAAFRPALQPAGLAVAFASIGSFLCLAYSVGGFNAGIRTVVTADIVAGILVIAAAALHIAAARAG